MSIVPQPALTTAAVTIDPSNFTTEINNPYFTLRPGTTFVYEDKAANTRNTFVVTWDTKLIMGVLCVVVHDTAYLNGQVIEDTYDWFAQDTLGNVWYFGEFTQEFKPGKFPDKPLNSAGSWEAGVDGAQPGILIKANPVVGEVYMQENAPGVAEDTVKVLALDETVNVVYGSFGDVLKTKDYTPLDPSAVERKYYVPGVGFVLATDRDGGHEELVKIIVEGRAGDDQLIGYAGGDEMRGLGGDDTMSGGSGNDRLKGNTGGDDLTGGAGNDWLDGGKGADAFVFQELTNGIPETDTIADYRKDQGDVIDLPGGAGSIDSYARVSGVWQLKLKGDGDAIVLSGVTDANKNGNILDDLLIV